MCWKYNKSAKQIHTSNYAQTRRLKRKPLRNDCKVYHNGLIIRVFMCRIVVIKHA